MTKQIIYMTQYLVQLKLILVLLSLSYSYSFFVEVLYTNNITMQVFEEKSEDKDWNSNDQDFSDDDFLEFQDEDAMKQQQQRMQQIGPVSKQGQQEYVYISQHDPQIKITLLHQHQKHQGIGAHQIWLQRQTSFITPSYSILCCNNYSNCLSEQLY
eukprot:TRINITY_DN5389_c1_g1_i2.p1 TRINITY_DN5389_c1_g1~~TRINITY_DN5389_c1_g1_i2.p1  ORF type:complete len:156 (-),score=2.95 TRINITY_DN5389_c1_g1_i2:327-794(-)